MTLEIARMFRNGKWETIAVQPMLTTVRTLTNAEIQALPTAPIEMVEAPGAGMLLAPILVAAAKDFSAGGYTNVGSGAATSLKVTYDADTSGHHSIISIAESNYLFFADDTVEQFPFPLGAVGDAVGGSFPPGGQDLRDTGIYVQSLNRDDSADLGDFAGGDSANTLKILVSYAVLDLR